MGQGVRFLPPVWVSILGIGGSVFAGTSGEMTDVVASSLWQVGVGVGAERCAAMILLVSSTSALRGTEG